MRHLVESRRELEAVTAELSHAQWLFRPDSSSWTPAEIVENVLASERAVRKLLFDDLTKQPPLPQNRRPQVRDLGILMVATNRDRRIDVAETVKPKGGATPPLEYLKDFLRLRAETIGYVMTTTHDLRSWAAEHPVIGVIDAYQWVLFLAGHCSRHTKQLMEVKAHRLFPRT